MVECLLFSATCTRCDYIIQPGRWQPIVFLCTATLHGFGISTGRTQIVLVQAMMGLSGVPNALFCKVFNNILKHTMKW